MRLEEINLPAYQYMESVSEQFNQICEPLFKLGVKYFNYYKIFSDSHFTLINHSKFLKVYLSQIKEAGDAFTEQINTAINAKRYNFFMPSDIALFDKRKNPLIHTLYDFNIWNSMTIFKLHPNKYIEIYAFSMTKNDLHAPQFYINNIRLLEHFTDYFNEKAKDLIDCRDKRKLAYSEQNFNFNAASEDDLLAQKIVQFLQETQLTSRFIKGKDNDLVLSKRETQCLEYLALGKSMKEIGRALDLSPRTIEFYFNNMKRKSGLSSKEEILVNFTKRNKNTSDK